jgi:hypothetical protein
VIYFLSFKFLYLIAGDPGGSGARRFLCAVLADGAVLAALETLESADGGRAGDMSTSRPGSDAVELTRVELIAKTARRLCCRL